MGVVHVAIKDTTRAVGSNWWRSDGTWGAFQNQNAGLGTPGGASTTWSFNWTPPASGSGSYSVQVEAVDTSNNVTPAPKPVRTFSVSATQRTRRNPTVAITVPSAANQSFAPGAINFSGTAADNVGVTAVRVGIQNTGTSQWLQANGTFGATQQMLAATVGTPGGDSTRAGRSTGRRPPAGAASYSVIAESQDAAGNVANPKPTRAFTSPRRPTPRSRRS